jgi:formylglycine-generating enzyme required for sulfatase activity
MVVVPAGSFMMGSPNSEERYSGYDGREEPQRKVTIARPFVVAKFEVTFAEWEACVAGGGCSRRPVINVSWSDAQEICDVAIAQDREKLPVAE